MTTVWLLLAAFVVGSLGQTVYWPRCGGNEQDALDWTVEYNAKSQEVWPVSIEADWKYNTDITPENQAAMVSVLISISSLILNYLNSCGRYMYFLEMAVSLDWLPGIYSRLKDMVKT